MRRSTRRTKVKENESNDTAVPDPDPDYVPDPDPVDDDVENVSVAVQSKETNDSDGEDDEVGSKNFPQACHVIPYKSNILNSLDGILYNNCRKKERRPLQEAMVRKLSVKGNLERFQQSSNTTQRFGRRITEISWSPKEPYLVGAACKFGDILLFRGSYDQHGELKMQQRLAIKGPGPDGAIFSIRYDERRRNLFYTAGLDSMVNCFDIEREGERVHEFYNTGDYNHWFTSMDVSQPTRTLLAGCTKGYIYLSTLDGENIAKTRIHKGKVFHVEFNQVLPHLIVTSSIDKTVKLWDLRQLSENKPLCVLSHEKPVNVARFNPLNSSRLLTSDQRYDIRVYRGPNWNQTTYIKQPHRQFQHLTAIVANWHPLSDIIVIGKYPVVPRGAPAPSRPIQFFDADSGDMIHQLFPTYNEIVSLNAFNPMGDILAAGQGRNLLFYNQQDHTQVLDKQSRLLKRKKDSYPDVHFDRHRQRARPDSDSGEEDDQDANEKKKRKRKGPSAKPPAAKKGKTSQSGTKTKKR